MTSYWSPDLYSPHVPKWLSSIPTWIWFPLTSQQPPALLVITSNVKIFNNRGVTLWLKINISYTYLFCCWAFRLSRIVSWMMLVHILPTLEEWSRYCSVDHFLLVHSCTATFLWIVIYMFFMVFCFTFWRTWKTRWEIPWMIYTLVRQGILLMPCGE